MRYGLRPATGLRAGRDEGFTLIEMLVGVAIIAVVMLGVGAAFIATAAGTDASGSKQVAVRIATDGLDRVHALGSGALNSGRDLASVQNQWAARPKAVKNLLGSLSMAYDATAAAGSGATAALPTVATDDVVDGVKYSRSFFVASCFLDNSQTCLKASILGTTVAMDNVVVSVSWPSKACGAATCTYAVSTLMASATVDPEFNTNLAVLAPVVKALSIETMDVTETLAAGIKPTVQSTSTLYYAATGLPAGITMNPQTGELVGTLGQNASGTYDVQITVTDAFGQAGQASATWTVNKLPTLASATTQLLDKPLDLNTVLQRSGGTGTPTWKCTGLVSGLSVSPEGILSGVATLVTSILKPSCTVTDTRNMTSNTATLTLTPLLGLSATASNPPASLTRGTAYTSVVTTSAANCLLGCTWSVSGQPTGLGITATGTTTAKVSGTVSRTATVKTYPVTITVTDGLGRTAKVQQNWTVK